MPRPGGIGLKIAGDRIEDAGQAAADSGESTDRGDRNQSGDQTVFDGGRAAIVTEEARKTMK